MALRLRYNNVLKKLYGLNKQFRVSMQLDRITQLHELLGRPMDNYGVIHVTGTNGKGSVCWKTATALHTQGYNVGLFSSPHIASFRERSRINMEMIEEEEVVSLMEELFALADRHDLQFSFFEMTTAFSLLHFARHDVDYAVLETGCGGRLDATNICAKPILTCITSIAIDHSTILGDTIPDICYHKAGIMKKGVPCIAGRRVPNDILEAYANECGATYVPFLIGADSKNDSLDNFVDFDTENANLVRQMLHFANRQSILELSEHSIETGATSRPPYRLEVVPLPATKLEHLPKVVFDSAHNTDAFDRLFDSVYAHFSDTGEGTHSLRVRVVLGFSGEKDVRACLKRVLEHVEVGRREAQHEHNTLNCVANGMVSVSSLTEFIL